MRNTIHLPLLRQNFRQETVLKFVITHVLCAPYVLSNLSSLIRLLWRQSLRWCVNPLKNLCTSAKNGHSSSNKITILTEATELVLYYWWLYHLDNLKVRVVLLVEIPLFDCNPKKRATNSEKNMTRVKIKWAQRKRCAAIAWLVFTLRCQHRTPILWNNPDLQTSQTIQPSF